MPKSIFNSKYSKANIIIHIWLVLLPDLTSTEAERMLHLTHLNEDQIPSRSRISRMITRRKTFVEDRIRNTKPLSDRDKRTFEIQRRKTLLDIVAKDPNLKSLRGDNLDYKIADDILSNFRRYS